jgi:hypothetical protein
MIRRRILATAATLFLGGILVAPAAVGATADPAVGTQVLNLLCNSKDGAPVFTPMTIARCQAARNRGDFQIEELICEGIFGGDFEAVGTHGRPKRINWFCFHGPIES